MKVDVSHIAKLASLPLSDSEKKKFEKQLEETLRHIENLNKIDTKNIDSTSQVTGLENVAREDVPAASLSHKEALSNAKSKEKGFFKIKGIFDET